MRRPRTSTIAALIFFAALLGGAAALFGARAAFAQVDLGLEQAASIGLATTDIRVMIGRVISYFFGLLGLIALGIMIYAGFLWMTAGGNEEQIQTAKKWMLNGTIGLVIIMSAFAITRFIIGAIQEGTGGGDGAGCVQGEVGCGPAGGLGGGGGGGFRVSGISPAGPGPSNGGWPKNYGITIGFSADVNPDTVTKDTIVVKKCNARVNGSGESQPFDLGECSALSYPGSPVGTGAKALFKPAKTDQNPDQYFDGDFWYYVSIPFGAVIENTHGVRVTCPAITSDISAASAPGNLCDRAVAFSQVVDLDAPTVVIDEPSRRYCADTIPVIATAKDDFLPASVDFALDGGSANLSSTSVVNTAPYQFTTSGVTIAAGPLADGTHTLTAIAYDGVPRPSDTASSDFIKSVAHCCNDIKDADETSVDKGGADCGADEGGSCTSNLDCAGAMSCVDGTCRPMPVIMAVSPLSAGPSSIIGLTGQYFGTAPGQVVFLGDMEDTDDDVVAATCDPKSWTDTYVGVTVPDGAPNGPVRITTADGLTDDTTASPQLGDFVLGSTTEPGICYIDPIEGNRGASFTVVGAGFEDSQPLGGKVLMGNYESSITQWNPTDIIGRVSATIPDGIYSVKVTGLSGGKEAGPIPYRVNPGASEETPRISSINPNAGPLDSYVTIEGSGFGSIEGKVMFLYDTKQTSGGKPVYEEASAGIPACGSNWRPNYIIVKVPRKYGCDSENDCGINKTLHAVEVRTQGGKRSNQVAFTVNTDPLLPGIACIDPDNGPATTDVTIQGEGFGKPTVQLPSSGYSVDFYGGAGLDTISADRYVSGAWVQERIVTAVPGDFDDKTTWPKTGPVSVTAGSLASSNTIPFTVKDCNDDPASCVGNTTCCATGPFRGSCRASCDPPPRSSAFGWNMSTGIVPAYPVVFRSACGSGTRASPTPADRSRGVCRDASIDLWFNTLMKGDTLVTNSLTEWSATRNVLVERCGTGGLPDCSVRIVDTFVGRLSIDLLPDGKDGTVLSLVPSSGDILEPNTWYNVTLLSDSDTGLGPKDVDGRLLDGNYDQTQGGDYEFAFQTREDERPCEITGVGVSPSAATIDHEGEPDAAPGGENDEGDNRGFVSVLKGPNCTVVRCEVTVDGAVEKRYDIAWSVEPAAAKDTVLTLTEPLLGACNDPMPVRAIEETAGAPIDLVVKAGKAGSVLEHRGVSEVTVDFADPFVMVRRPDCDEACTNAEIGASFNVRMDGNSFANAVFLYRCTNENCRTFDPQTIDISTSMTEEGRRATFTPDTPLLPASFYKVMVKGTGLTAGDTAFVKSRSGVGLTQLNDGKYYSWVFRTRDSGMACGVYRTSVQPANVRLMYVDERAKLDSFPYSQPDKCDPAGQALDPKSVDWQWTSTAGVVDAFFAADKVTGFVSRNTELGSTGLRIDTAPVPVRGCSESCIAAGSQRAISQCGNSLREVGEECEIGDDDAKPNALPDWCDPNTCLYNGNNGSCNDGVLETDEGEQCEVVDGKWAAWCEPNKCRVLGAEKGGSTCGNGSVGDGEACDDGNMDGGDGCSALCLKEGSRPRCEGNPFPKGCVSYCGNGVQEPGEDVGCDIGGTQKVATGCDIDTCVYKGTPSCGNDPGRSDCCGNGGSEEAGEECEALIPGGPLPAYCTKNCLLKGSSYSYVPTPSFCGDGITGDGEDKACEVSVIPDQNVDAGQVIMSRAPSTEGATSVVTATTEGVEAAKAGTADVSLSCTCREIGTVEQGHAFCRGLSTTPLGCGLDGCCAPAPGVSSIVPKDGSTDQCRNTAVRITFDQPMNADSVRRSFFVGEKHDDGSACAKTCTGNREKACTTDADCQGFGRCEDTVVSTVQVSFGASGDGSARRGWWDRIVDFVRSLFGAGARAATTAVYCAVPGSIAVSDQAVLFSPVNALKADADYRVVVVGDARCRQDLDLSCTSDADCPKDGQGKTVEESCIAGAKSLAGVPVIGHPTFNFSTGPDICRIGSIEITPPSHLFSVAEDLPSNDAEDGDEEFEALAHPVNRAAELITPTREYNFKWDWSATANDSVIELSPKTASAPVDGNGWCEQGEAATADDCVVDLQDAADPKPASSCGNGICEADAAKPERASCTDPSACAECKADCQVNAAESSIAVVSVRRSPTDKFPHNGQETIQVTADVSERQVVKSHFAATSDIVVMLCKVPWPARRDCVPAAGGGGEVSIPWDQKRCSVTRDRSCRVNADCPASESCTNYKVSCLENTRVWFPFYEPDTRFSSFYCRDAASAGAEGASLLPELNETVARVQQPSRDVFREYLLTYKNPLAGDPWKRDAIGVRVGFNSQHLGIADWYRQRGFRGSPSPIVVDGYDALREDRTAYVNAAAVNQDKIFTNINVLSYSDGASPETVAVFGQLLGNINLNKDLKNIGLCKDAAGSQVGTMVCEKDRAKVCVADSECGGEGDLCVPRKACSNNAANSCVADSECGGGECRVVSQNPPIRCTADRDCRIGPNGAFSAARAAYFCDAVRDKLRRDVRRWADLQSMRSVLSARASSGFPTLTAGTYLSGVSNSTWPSWSQQFATELGRPFPTDPLNVHGKCTDSGYAAGTCWNDSAKTYVCPDSSFVYRYESIGGQEYKLSVDTETTCADLSSKGQCDAMQGLCNWATGSSPGCVRYASWSGDTCVERSVATCRRNADAGQCANDASKSCTVGTQSADCAGGTCNVECAVKNGKCAYATGRGEIELGAAALDRPTNFCDGTPVGATGRCGDGVVQRSGCPSGQPCEQCEFTSPPDAQSCTVGGRGGTQTRNCTTSCQWEATWGTCQAGSCGDGVVQSPEKCDNGSLNGRYGYCKSDCSGIGAACGDTTRQPNEACECRGDNGAYRFNGVVNPGTTACGTATGASAASCAWDCNGPGPRCGDGVVNGANEACDDDADQLAYGYCQSVTGQPGCARDGDCATGTCVRMPGNHCQTIDPNPANWTTCTVDADCSKVTWSSSSTGTIQCQSQRGANCDCIGASCTPDGTPDSGCGTSYSSGTAKCITATKCIQNCPSDRQMRRSCNQNRFDSVADDPGVSREVQACQWSVWRCDLPGACGNGKEDAGEECDDGTASGNQDACIIDPGAGVYCRENVCGDGYVQVGTEQCDEGAKNGTACIPKYGLSCNYCSTSCTNLTVSAPFCGDGGLQNPITTPPGPEECDGRLGLEDYVCMSTKAYYQPFGRIVARVKCNESDCRRICPVPDSELCLNTGSTNTDGDQFKFCGNAFDKTCTSDAECGPGGTCLTIPLKDSPCDPDKDNDGVPAVLPAGQTSDCNDLVKTVHPAYSFSKPPTGCPASDPANKVNITSGSTTCSVAEVVEECNNTDDNCNGQTDEGIMAIVGKVSGTTGAAIANTSVKAFCGRTGTAQLDSETTGSDGRYRLEFRVSSCSSNDIRVEVVQPGAFCQTNTVVAKTANCWPADTNFQLATGTLTIKGDAKDALFVEWPIANADVELSPAVCANDASISCLTDAECASVGGQCGLPKGHSRNVKTTTDSQGIYQFNNIMPGSASCQVKITVYSPANPVNVTGITGIADGSLILDRSSGYWPASRSLPSTTFVNTPICTTSPSQLCMPRVFMMPKAAAHKAIAAMTWNGSIRSSSGGYPITFLDAHLGNDRIPYRTYYSAKGNSNLTVSPYSYLSCFHEDGTDSCGSFSTAPETMTWSWATASLTKPVTYHFFIDDYGCAAPCARNAFVRDGETRALISTNTGLVTIQPPSTNGKWWHIMDLVGNSDGTATVSIVNQITNTRPTAY